MDWPFPVQDVKEGAARLLVPDVPRRKGPGTAGPWPFYNPTMTVNRDLAAMIAYLKQRGVAYNRVIPAATAAGITLNRKMLSELASSDPQTFDAIVEKVKPHLT